MSHFRYHSPKLVQFLCYILNVFFEIQNHILRLIRNLAWFNVVLTSHQSNSWISRHTIKSCYNSWSHTLKLTLNLIKFQADFTRFFIKMYWLFQDKLDENQWAIFCHRRPFYGVAKDKNKKSQIFHTWHFDCLVSPEALKSCIFAHIILIRHLIMQTKEWNLWDTRIFTFFVVFHAEFVNFMTRAIWIDRNLR